MLYSSSTVLQIIQQNLSSSRSTQVRQQVLLCNIHKVLHICPITVAYDFYLKTEPNEAMLEVSNFLFFSV